MLETSLAHVHRDCAGFRRGAVVWVWGGKAGGPSNKTKWEKEERKRIGGRGGGEGGEASRSKERKALVLQVIDCINTSVEACFHLHQLTCSFKDNP